MSMTNEELRQLDAEADAYQADADAQRRPVWTDAHMHEVRRALSAWERAYKYEHAVRTRIERMVEWNKLQGQPSAQMLADLEAARKLAADHLALALKETSL